ncbi:MAG TPA: signal peptidase I [Candidatus Saccharimonadales bacterium]|nr:signal peptidase I [Candidatus Saccharimonadales bacterium]
MPEEKSSLWSTVVDVIETVVVAAAIFVVVYLFLLQPHQVRGASMKPNFQDGQYILTDKISYRFAQPKRGEVIIFKAPTDMDVDFIKRIIGLPGERVKISDGKVTIYNDQNKNGFVLNEPYQTLGPTSGGKEAPQNTEVTIPKDQYFVLGDNRLESFDSRSWGTLPKKNIIGKAWLRYWPLSQIGFITHPTY